MRIPGLLSSCHPVDLHDLEEYPRWLESFCGPWQGRVDDSISIAVSAALRPLEHEQPAHLRVPSSARTPRHSTSQPLLSSRPFLHP
jgi:hypothetical protein